MALSFPLTLAEFFDTLPIKSVSFDLGESIEMSQTEAGEILTAEMGPRLWRATVNIRVGQYAEIEQVKAKINLLRYPGRSLLVHKIPLKAPQYDPTGTVLGSSAVLLHTVQSNNREIRLNGLPVGYEITVGDCLSFTYGSNPVRYAMHQVATNAVADGSGLTNLFEVTPFIEPGFVLNSAVTLIKPKFKAILVPGSFNPGESGSKFTDGVSFEVIQTMR